MPVRYDLSRLLLTVASIASLCAVSSAAVAQQNTAKNVLALYSEQVETENYAALAEGLRSGLQSQDKFPVEIYSEHLDLLRFVDAPHQENLAAYLRAKYADRRIDLIVVIGSSAFKFITERGEAIFPGVPIVFTSVGITRIEERPLRRTVTGIAVKRDYGDTIDLILRLQPDTTEIVIPVGATSLEKTWTMEIRDSLKSFEPRVRLTYLSDLPMTELLRRLAKLPAHTAVLYSPLFSNDAAGRHFLPEEALALMVPASAAPIYGTNDSYLGLGIVGGALYRLSEVGAAAGRVGARVLDGEAPATIPVETLNPNHRMFDARQIERWGISRARLPGDSIVQFTQPSVWSLYKGYIIGSLALVMLQAWMILRLVMQARRLKNSESLLKELSGHLLNAQDAERTRIARELHDDFGQRLALLKIELELLPQEWPEHVSAGRAKLRPIISQIEELSADLHTLSHMLHSSRLQLLGLRSALEELCANIARQHHVTVELGGGPLAPQIPPDIALCLYRIAQEGLHNAAKHSGAGRIDVELTDNNALLRMKITDGGKGFDPGRASKGLGLASMRERVRMIGGELDIVSAPGRGTTLVAQVRSVASTPAA
jgi:signal transduction histidine kinase